MRSRWATIHAEEKNYGTLLKQRGGGRGVKLHRRISTGNNKRIDDLNILLFSRHVSPSCCDLVTRMCVRVLDLMLFYCLMD